MKKNKGMKRFYYPLMGILLMAASCSNTSSAKEEIVQDGAVAELVTGGQEEVKAKVERDAANVHIEGTVTGAANSPIYLQIVESKGIKAIDTITGGPNGEYSFDYMSDQPECYRVGVNEQNSFYMILYPGESVVAKSNIDNLFKTYEIIEGPEECLRMKEMNTITSMMDSINMILQAAQMNKDQNMFQNALTQHDNISIRMNLEIKAYISRKPASLSSLAALQNLSFDEEFDYYLKVVQALDGIANGNDIYDNMASQILKRWGL